jgi:thiamine biosynthesis lipoprotein
LVVDDPAALSAARVLLARQVHELDAAASRSGADSEISRVAAAAGRPVRVSPLLADLVAVALAAAAADRAAANVASPQPSSGARTRRPG